jgi:HPt (histidine-containing phosphotransfer) domain-containing protein
MAKLQAAVGILFAVPLAMDDLRDLQLDYLADLGPTIDQIREHSERLSTQSGVKTAFPALLFLAHQLKGSGGSLGFPRISELAGRMREELNLFLDQEQVSPPTLPVLSQRMVALAEELQREVEAAARVLA